MTADNPNEWFIDNHDFLSDLGLRLEHEESGFVRISLPFDETLANPDSGVLQGGVVATLIDHAGGAALRTTLEGDPFETGHASTDLSVSYVRPAVSKLTAEATVIRTGWSMAVVRVEVSNTDDEVVADGRVTLHLDRG